MKSAVRLSFHSVLLGALWFLTAAIAFAQSAAPSLEETYAAQGRLILAPFASAPFPHPALTNTLATDGKTALAAPGPPEAGKSSHPCRLH
jgi:hypothetical protein